MLRVQKFLLILSILMSGFCGIIAELSLFNLANTLLGSMNIVLTYTMGVMMFFMGVGALAVRFPLVHRHLFPGFVWVEGLLSLVTGASVFSIYILSAIHPPLTLVWVLGFSACIGFLIGFEIPLILLMNESLKAPLVRNSSLVLFADYAGSLLAFVLFSHWLLESWGLPGSVLLASGINGFIALTTVLAFRTRFTRLSWPLISLLLLAAVWGTGVWFTGDIMDRAEQKHYRDPIIFKHQTPYQKIVVTGPGSLQNRDYLEAHREKAKKWLFEERFSPEKLVQLGAFKDKHAQKDLRFYINGGLQFSTYDEAYYHEMLVHPALHLLRPGGLRVLIGGGGDGLALREVLKYPEVKEVALVDLDAHVTGLFRNHPLFASLNDSALHDPRVTVYNGDFFQFLKQDTGKWDLVLLDFPDPSSAGTAKLYSRQFYLMMRDRLRRSGVMATQATSPFFSPAAYRIIGKTLEEVFGQGVLPYKVAMPTFGLWGFYLVRPSEPVSEMAARLDQFAPKVPMKVVNRALVQAGTRWDRKTLRGGKEYPVHDLNRPVLEKAYSQFP